MLLFTFILSFSCLFQSRTAPPRERGLYIVFSFFFFSLIRAKPSGIFSVFFLVRDTLVLSSLFLVEILLCSRSSTQFYTWDTISKEIILNNDTYISQTHNSVHAIPYTIVSLNLHFHSTVLIGMTTK